MSLSVAALSTFVIGIPSDVSAGFAHLAHVAAPVAVTALWQGLAVALALHLALWLAPRISAAQRFAAWAIGFGTAAVLPLVPLMGRASSATAAVTKMAAAGQHAWLELAPEWSVAIALLWAAASLLRVVDLGVHVARLRKIWTSAVPVDLPMEVNGVEVASWPSRTVQICSTTTLDRPSVIGFLAPRILVPAWLLERLTPGELEQVVLHEAEHLRRRDDWTNLLQKICLVVFPLNPALWWMEQRLCREREMACDEGVVEQTRAPRAYAACLTSLAERGLARRSEALTLGTWQRRPELVDRVHRILKQSPQMSPLATGAFLSVLVGGLVAGSAELVRCPQLVAFESSRPSAGATLEAATVRTRFSVKPVAPGEDAKAFVLPAAVKARTRTVTTMAVMRETASPSTSDRLRGHTQEPHAIEVRAEMPGASGTAPVGGAGTEYVVVTAWEQVEIAQAAPQVQADYEIAVTPDRPNTSSAVEQFTVTRLIFRVVPKVPTPGTRPIVREGWLALQL